MNLWQIPKKLVLAMLATYFWTKALKHARKCEYTKALAALDNTIVTRVNNNRINLLKGFLLCASGNRTQGKKLLMSLTKDIESSKKFNSDEKLYLNHYIKNMCSIVDNDDLEQHDHLREVYAMENVCEDLRIEFPVYPEDKLI